MPKIFWIKNRLHEQQQRLALQNGHIKHGSDNASQAAASYLGDTCEPLSLIVNKREGMYSFKIF